jgi:asparagine synthase (glutamine-hydrolysing)
LGGIAAAVGRDRPDSEALVATMLEAMKHRGTEAGILKEVVSENHISALGYALNMGSDHQVCASRTAETVLDGSIFRSNASGRFVSKYLQRIVPLTRAVRSILQEPAGFACVFRHNDRLYAFRDLNGMKPLHFGRNDDITAIASERKALWRIGLKNTERICPGQLYVFTNGARSHTTVCNIPSPREGKMTMRQASSRLSLLLQRSAQRIVQRIDKVAVAFSGGIDSALTALLAKRTGAKVEAVSAGLVGSSELSSVDHFARELNVPLTVETYSPNALEEYVRRILWLVEDPSMMKVSVAIPLHWAARIAANLGCRIMLCGQGSDELYGGYYKYARTLDNKGRKALTAELYRSIIDSPQVNYERDDQATSPFGIELRTIFADLDVINFSLSIPSKFKVRLGNDVTRKWVLRYAAKHLGLPDDIVWRRKKAIQHGTGVENAIRKIAKNHGMTAERYLLKVHEEVMNSESMP